AVELIERLARRAPRAWIGQRILRPVVRLAGVEDRFRVPEVAVVGLALHTRAVGNRLHGRAGGPDRPMELDGGLDDAAPRVVDHPMPPRSLAAPLHLHTREDEYSFVVEGRMGALLGDEVVEAGPGDLVFKPRNEWHTFWNPTDEPTRILEIISPAGFERFFDELVDLRASGEFDLKRFAELRERYGLEMQVESIPELLERFALSPRGWAA